MGLGSAGIVGLAVGLQLHGMKFLLASKSKVDKVLAYLVAILTFLALITFLSKGIFLLAAIGAEPLLGLFFFIVGAVVMVAVILYYFVIEH